MTQNADSATRDCPATREAVKGREVYGEFGCPLCGAPAEDHWTEAEANDDA